MVVIVVVVVVVVTVMSMMRFDVYKFNDTSDFNLWYIKKRDLLVQQGLFKILKDINDSCNGDRSRSKSKSMKIK